MAISRHEITAALITGVLAQMLATVANDTNADKYTVPATQIALA
ncbi:hypothetical protein [Shewanella pealeana]|nr:hypothetical protein [Shewanella pealeana]